MLQVMHVNGYCVTFKCLGFDTFHIHNVHSIDDMSGIVDNNEIHRKVGVEINGNEFAEVLAILVDMLG